MQNAKKQGGGQAKTAITPTRAQDFPEWYQQVVRAADMAENAPVRGCMIIKPYGYAIWENIQRIFDGMIKDAGVQNAYFPLLIPLSFMSREAEHVDGFAKECAVVTHHRLIAGEKGLVPDAPLEEPLVIRPTSETIIGDAMARWVHSYRDLPLKLNQWANVMRWEMRPRLFLRTSEFLWQEGHNAFETADEAREDVMKMIGMYADFARNTLAMPVIVGEKTPEERFPGANATYAIESMMQDGKALQSGTSHDLGQNFSKSIGIAFQGRDGQQHFAHTTSWGISTRLIGGMIMTHGDDDGLICPPRVAPCHVGIIPVLRDESTTPAIMAYANELAERLKVRGVRVQIDSSDARTPDKMWSAIKKGIPVRVEIGQRETEERTLTVVRRDLGRESKATCGIESFVGESLALLDEIHDSLLARAQTFMDAHITDVRSVAEIDSFYKEGGIGFVRSDTACVRDPAFESLRQTHKISARCMPFTEEGRKVIVGRSY